MNARQSLVGFDFHRFNQEYITRSRPTTNGGPASGGSSGGATNDAERYGVRIVPAQVAGGQLYWRAIGVRHLEPAENKGKHNLYAELLDEEGKRVRDANAQLQRGWEGQRPDESSPLVRFDKGDNEPATNIPIDRNQKLWVRVTGDLPSDTVENLHTKHADEAGPGGELWNSIGHHSFYVVFQRTRQAVATVPPVTKPAEPAPKPVEPKPVEPKPPVGDAQTENDATYVEGRDAVPVLATMGPGQRFEQSWQIRNTGKTRWNAVYRLICVGGNRMGAPATIATPACAPGEEVRVTVPFVAPVAPGAHHSVWRMADARGEPFGERLWLVVVVASPPEGVAAPVGRNLRPVAEPSEPPTDAPSEAATVISASTTPSTATPRLPEITSGAMRDPELYAAWKKHIEHGFANNQTMFQQLLTGFMNPYWTTVWMYRILFGLGVASFVVAAGLSAFANKEGYTLIFGGLSALSLLAYFFNRPLQALEENLQFITWLGLIYNSYWTRLLYLNSQPDVQKGLQESTDDAIARIKELMAAHAKRSRKRVPFPE
jgi:hypothetical protein